MTNIIKYQWFMWYPHMCAVIRTCTLSVYALLTFRQLLAYMKYDYVVQEQGTGGPIPNTEDREDRRQDAQAYPCPT